MNNFVRALKKTLRFWPSLVMAAVCSFTVAALWSANIGAFYPILEVTIRGKSMHAWIDDEIAKNVTLIADVGEQKSSTEARVAAGGLAEADATLVQTELLELNNQLDASESRLKNYRRMEPWIKALVPDGPFETIAMIVAALILSTLVKHFFLISNEYLVGRVALDVSRSIRMQVFEKALGMDRKSYNTYGTGGFTASITHTTDMLSNGLINALGAALREPLKVITCLIGAGIICWRLLALSVVIAPLVGFMLYFVTRKIRSISRTQLSKAQGYHEVMLEGLGNINTVQTHCMEHHEIQRFDDATMAMRNFALKFIFYTSLSKPIIEFLGLGMLGTTIIGGAYLVLNKETSLMGIPICEEPLSVSALLVFFGMLIGISDPLRKLSAVYASIHAAGMAADGIYGMLDHGNALEEPANPKKIDGRHKMLRLEDVAFGYAPGQPVLRDVDLDIPFGSTIAIVGHNGSGKSTLIHLLSRFYDPVQGKLAFDDVDFREMSVADVRGRIALVNQQTELFNDTVEYNIRYGEPTASQADVLAASKLAQADEFISTVLEDGYETGVGANGNKLSGGQRQRIALARALLCKPEILILDEATSQIDMRSEQLIRESLATLRGQQTMIIITHREKLLELADRVFEVVDGQLVEQSDYGNSAAA